MQCCESGSGWIRKFLLDPVFFVLDPEPGKKKKKIFLFLFPLIEQKTQWNVPLK